MKETKRRTSRKYDLVMGLIFGSVFNDTADSSVYTASQNCIIASNSSEWNEKEEVVAQFNVTCHLLMGLR
jgi:hypothetical protein